MKKVLVIGDSCLDVFVYCQATRLAPDFPVPVLHKVREVQNPGMAMNVKANIEVFLECDIFTNSDWRTQMKTRHVHENTNHMFIRVDAGDPIRPAVVSGLNLDYDLVVISDYNKGFLSCEDIAEICSRHPNVFLDTKKILGKWAEGAKHIKINDTEFRNSEPFLTDSLREKIIRTMGGEGCRYLETQYRVNTVEVKDVSGAGDSFMAALVVNYLETKDIVKAIHFANELAAEVVKHRGVTLIAPPKR